MNYKNTTHVREFCQTPQKHLSFAPFPITFPHSQKLAILPTFIIITSLHFDLPPNRASLHLYTCSLTLLILKIDISFNLFYSITRILFFPFHFLVMHLVEEPGPFDL